MYHPILRPGGQRQLKKIGTADLVIGLPTYKNARNAARVARVITAGVDQYYPHLRTVLINADAGLKATTRRAVADQVAHDGGLNVTVVSGRYDGPLGPGSAAAAVLDAALALDPKVIVILDSHTETITPNWIGGLAHLILEEKVDLVLPRYRWSSLAPGSSLSDLIIYPLFRALWGQSLRHPAAPDFALSPQLASALLDEDIWETGVTTLNLTPWLTTYAALNDWRVAQSALGEKRTWLDFDQASHNQTERKRAKKAAGRIKSQFQNVMNVMLRLVYDYRDHWTQVDDFYSLSTLTQFMAKVNPTPAPERDPTLLLDELALGWIEYRVLWQHILTSDNLVHLEALAVLPPDRFYFPADLWARIIYDFAVVFNKGEWDPDKIVDSLYPLYQGRLAAFWQEIAGLTLVGREGTIAAQAVEFEETRPYLKKRWQTYQPWPHGSEIR